MNGMETRPPMDIVEQVEQLERMRASGLVDDAWYHRARAQLVRRYRVARRRNATTLEIRLDQDELVR